VREQRQGGRGEREKKEERQRGRTEKVRRQRFGGGKRGQRGGLERDREVL
jgi:hypothetical protein